MRVEPEKEVIINSDTIVSCPSCKKYTRLHLGKVITLKKFYKCGFCGAYCKGSSWLLNKIQG